MNRRIPGRNRPQAPREVSTGRTGWPRVPRPFGRCPAPPRSAGTRRSNRGPGWPERPPAGRPSSLARPRSHLTRLCGHRGRQPGRFGPPLAPVNFALAYARIRLSERISKIRQGHMAHYTGDQPGLIGFVVNVYFIRICLQNVMWYVMMRPCSEEFYITELIMNCRLHG
jgi:hypothetical protein